MKYNIEEDCKLLIFDYNKYFNRNGENLKDSKKSKRMAYKEIEVWHWKCIGIASFCIFKW